MKMPRHESAIVPEEKITDYLLSATHPRGSLKARWFRAFGYTQEQPAELMRSLLDLATLDVESTEITKYGTKYNITGQITGPNGHSAEVRTVWILLNEASAPRLVTAYPRK